MLYSEKYYCNLGINEHSVVSRHKLKNSETVTYTVKRLETCDLQPVVIKCIQISLYNGKYL
jgi:hypothetical protein